MSAKNKEYSLTELTNGLDVKIVGNPQTRISGVCPIQESRKGHITFLINAYYKKYLASTEAAAIITTEELAANCTVNAIVCSNPHYTYARIAEYFAEEEVKPAARLHPISVIGAGCEIDKTADVGPYCVIGDGVKIGPNVRIGAGTIIGPQVQIGADTQIDANVTLYHHVKIGCRCRIASGAVIGSEGFGFANNKGVWHKVPQLGSVTIGNDVDVGSNTSIDRGAVEDTVIEDGVKLDNLIQVAHNVRIGAHTIIAGCVAIAGSVVFGKNCMIGGGSCFAGHISICDGAMVTGMTAVTKSITEPGVYSSGIVGAVPNHEFRKNNARFHRLENLMQKVKQLEADVKELKERKS